MNSPEYNQGAKYEASEQNPWNIYGPYYSEDAVRSDGLEVDRLVEVITVDGVKLYPSGQFDNKSERLKPNTEITEVWNQTVRPAIAEGLIDGWTALGLFFHRHEDGRTRADILAAPASEEERQLAINVIKRVIHRLSH